MGLIGCVLLEECLEFLEVKWNESDAKLLLQGRILANTSLCIAVFWELVLTDVLLLLGGFSLREWSIIAI